MCMLFIKPENLALPENYIDNLWLNNSDGLSVLNTKTGKLFKTLDKKDAFKMLLNAKDELICHFRYATSGDTDYHQLHGFNICKNEYLFFHNGVLSTFKGDSYLSDTQQIANYFSDKTIDFVIDYLETYEKSSRFLIYNKKTGEIIKPCCATWVGDVAVNDGYINFSNDYAIDYCLLYGDDFDYDSGYDSYAHFDDDGYNYINDYGKLEHLIKNRQYSKLDDFVTDNPNLITDYLIKNINKLGL